MIQILCLRYPDCLLQFLKIWHLHWILCSHFPGNDLEFLPKKTSVMKSGTNGGCTRWIPIFPLLRIQKASLPPEGNKILTGGESMRNMTWHASLVGNLQVKEELMSIGKKHPELPTSSEDSNTRISRRLQNAYYLLVTAMRSLRLVFRWTKASWMFVGAY